MEVRELLYNGGPLGVKIYRTSDGGMVYDNHCSAWDFFTMNPDTCSRMKYTRASGYHYFPDIHTRVNRISGYVPTAMNMLFCKPRFTKADVPTTGVTVLSSLNITKYHKVCLYTRLLKERDDTIASLFYEVMEGANKEYLKIAMSQRPEVRFHTYCLLCKHGEVFKENLEKYPFLPVLSSVVNEDLKYYEPHEMLAFSRVEDISEKEVDLLFKILSASSRYLVSNSCIKSLLSCDRTSIRYIHSCLFNPSLSMKERRHLIRNYDPTYFSKPDESKDILGGYLSNEKLCNLFDKVTTNLTCSGTLYYNNRRLKLYKTSFLEFKECEDKVIFANPRNKQKVADFLSTPYILAFKTRNNIGVAVFEDRDITLPRQKAIRYEVDGKKFTVRYMYDKNASTIRLQRQMSQVTEVDGTSWSSS